MSTNNIDSVVIVLDGEEKTLTPTFGAARAISARYGGVGPAIDRVLKLEHEIVLDIVALGLGYFPPKSPPKELGEQVWRTGLTDDTGGLAHHCVVFLQMIAGGGRLPSRGADEEGDGPAGPQ